MAKNVGIRQARGRFVLATNIGIIFSTELIDFIASRRLQPGYLYRADRHDVQAQFPVDAQLDVQMNYCASHQLRIHTRRGIKSVEPSGQTTELPQPISDGRTVRLGGGWHTRESSQGSRPHQWGDDRAELIVDLEAAGILDDAVLDLDLEASPYGEVELLAVEDNRPLLRTRIVGRTQVGIRLPRADGDRERRIELRATSDGGAIQPLLQRAGRTDAVHYRISSARVRRASDSGRFEHPASGWTRAAADSPVTLARTADGVLVTSDPRKWSYCAKYGPLRASKNGIHTFEVVYELVEGQITVGVLTGDESRWLPSSVQLYQGARLRQGEVAVALRSNQQFWLVISNDHPDGDGVSRFVIRRMECSVAPQTVHLSKRGQTRVGRLLRKLGEHGQRWRWRLATWRLADGVVGALAAGVGDRVRSRIVRVTERECLEQALQPPAEQGREPAPAGNPSVFNTVLPRRRPGDLHVTACGDFQLMIREHWNELRAYPELETFPMNIGGLFSRLADTAGIKEHVLDMPIYHIEHKVAAGPPPEREALLRQRIGELEITKRDRIAVSIVGACTRWLRCPVTFNPPGWGSASETLTERTVPRQVSPR